IKAEQAVMKQDILEIKAEQAVMKQDITDVKRELRQLRVLVDEDIHKHISIIAEGHAIILKQIAEMHEMYMKYEKLALNVEVHNLQIAEIQHKLSMA
ncbi:MAG: hypothetical protein Q4D16_15040, partial [Eubacteriales bacterium]|nr:hypothetical protein [Eubacteriales bacterium]